MSTLTYRYSLHFHERTQLVITNHDTAELLLENGGVSAWGPILINAVGNWARLSQNTTNKLMREMPQRLKYCIKGVKSL
jgi:hypothetical protein